ncbi:hypothetical protein [Sphingobacterium yanglingense]|uniref:Putative hotdog family 3-hydroxylacyl-ACP dehydratase n=1 Tax=Sphingobacterium yanglingense TaxID=1437280 RepID=A0A4V3DDD4_9SPHI|nr:hypothetical protein [Sphingobacterium yanglingense]TDQ75860.1 putative hotdog family 3-hydroxylacyl-ACP dehydratase [Sphingobacterium yanglingense]
MTEGVIKIPIHEFLPHRAPMLMVDYIVEISQGHVICEYTIESDCIFLVDEFLQEVGLIEHMAQTCSSIVGQNYYTEDYNPEVDERVIGFISAIKSVCIECLPKKEQRIRTTARLVSQFEGAGYTICTMSVIAEVLGDQIAEAEINLFLQERKP